MILSGDKHEFFLSDTELKFYKNFYSEKKSDTLFDYLKNDIDWKSYKIKIFGKEYDQPRLTAFYDNSGKGYNYSNIRLKSQKMNPVLLQISNEIRDVTDKDFNSVLLNFYRNGNDSNSWHADNETELGVNPIIASVSLGENRYFHFKHNKLKTESYKILLTHGSLLIMAGEMQHNWKHQIAKSKKEMGERINLTFRQL